MPAGPLWRPPAVLASLLRWLRVNLRDRRRAATAATLSGACGLLIHFYRRQMAALRAVRLMPISELLQAVEAGRVESAVVSLGACMCQLAGGQQCRTAMLPVDAKLLVKLLHKHGVPWRSQGPSSWRALLVLLVPFAYLGACGYMLWRMTNDGSLVGGGPDGGGAGDASSPSQPSIGWEDIGGMSSVKAAVMEVVDIIHRPEAYARMGARCPRGILLAGPPGTGKTLLARAVATEAGVPFICCTGSDFVEVFVGRGARRVRNLFEEAGRRAPCVLFIDELDALGSARSSRSGGSCEEHDHTLNQLLAMMDGFGASPGVLVMAATNRLSALDPALTRPGRFDRVLELQLPDEAGRLAILRVHASRTPLDAADDVLPRIASATQGFSGAELAALVNEASVGAVRDKEARVRAKHYDRALREFFTHARTGKKRGSDGSSAEQQLQAYASMLQSALSGELRSGNVLGATSSVEENE